MPDSREATTPPKTVIVGDATLGPLLPGARVVRTPAEAGPAGDSPGVVVLALATEPGTVAALEDLAESGAAAVCVLPGMADDTALRLLRAGASECLPREGLDSERLRTACARAEARAGSVASLRAREARYRTLVEQDADAIVLFDRDLRIVYVNDGTRRLIGWTPSEAVGRQAMEFTTPEGAAQLLAALGWILANPGQHHHTHGEIRHRDGHLVHVEGSLINLLGEPHTAAIVMSFRDVADKDEQTRALQRNEARFRAIAEETPVPVWLEDADRNLIYENRTALEFVGRNFESEAGTGWMETVHPEDLARVVQHYQKSTAEPRNISLEFRMRRHDGAWRNLLQIAIPRLDDAGRLLGFLGVDVDITDLKTKAARTEAAEERYRLFVERSAEGIWRFEVDPPIPTDLPPEEQIPLMARHGVLAECNLAMARQYGRDDPRELIGAHITDLLDPAEPKNREFLLAFIAGGYQVVDAESHEFDKQHRRLVFLNTLIGIVEDGRLIRVWGLQRDVTERVQLEEEARQVRKMETAGRLAGGIAHDFNNLLTAILGTSEILLSDLDPQSEQHADVEEIKRAATRAAGLTHQLLAFSRRQVLQPKVIDLNSLVRGVESLLRRLIGEHIQLSTRAGPDLWCVKADPGQMEQVVVNLCVNARDAMPTGGAVVIETSNIQLDSSPEGSEAVIPPGRYVLLTVSDTGVGMDAETQLHLFEPFFTTKEPGKGTGLGLATVYGIVKQSGGYIFVESAPGSGTQFRIYLPRVDGVPEVAFPPPPAVPDESGQGTILLVEDEESVRRLARRILEGVGYRILEAADGAEALAVAGAWQDELDLVITDVIMPEMSGQELSSRLREDAPGLRILYVSGYTDDAILQHGALLPNTAFLQKPFTPAGLVQRVADVLRK